MDWGGGTLAVCLVTSGILLLCLEFNVPGKVVPGCIGVLLLLRGIFLLAHLPLRGFALALCACGALMLLGTGCLPSRLKRRGWALLPLGTLLLTCGLARLVANPSEPVALPIAAVASTLLAGATVALGRIASLARGNKFTLGPAGMCGKLATVCLAPVPTPDADLEACAALRVEIAGEIWSARPTPGGVALQAGQTVVVQGVKGSTLLVAPTEKPGRMAWFRPRPAPAR